MSRACRATRHEARAKAPHLAGTVRSPGDAIGLAVGAAAAILPL
jgi:hypothetical protein